MVTELQRHDYEGLRRAFRWQIPENFNIGRGCSDHQDAASPALIHVTRTGEVDNYTFGDITQLSNRFANVLRGLGAVRGDRVAIVLPQSPQTATAHLAAYKLGCVAVPLSVLFGPDALRYRLSDSAARVVVTDAAGLERIGELIDELSDLEAIVVAEPAGTSDRRVVSFADAVASASPELDSVQTSADDAALLIYTSGTTGPPKGALHAHRCLLGHLPGFELSHEFFPRPDDLFWTPADWAWIGGLMDALLPTWHHGRPIVAAARAGFDPEWALRLIADHDVRNAFLPPTALKMVRQSGQRPQNLRLRTVMSGGEPLGDEVLTWAREALGVTINEIYGQTEANYIVGNCAVAWPVRPGSMGRPYPGHEISLQDEAGEAVAPGAVGEVVVRRPDPVMFLEYWGRPDATDEKFRGDWLRTGDLARWDEDGYLWFQGRSDDVISSAGYRIGPAEIEAALIRHPAVAMAAVIGVPDELRGEAIKAFIKLRAGQSPSEALEDEIRRHVRDRLAAYQYPRIVEFVDDFPLTTTGKIQRAELRRQEAARRP